MKDVVINGVTYNGISSVQLTTTAGGTANFKDVEEIATPGGSASVETGTFVGDGTYNVTMPVTSKKQGYIIIAENYDSLSTDASALGNMCILYEFFDAANGMCGNRRVYNGGVISAVQGTDVTNVTMTDSAVIKSKPLMYMQEHYASGETYRWIAW